ncbi:ATP-binding protein [Zoogloea sp.]|uniref:sensor histidine kinase n=1 Tax=Zoogloea sp. TaxID=49181 RepID=UPI0035AFB791
MKFGRLFWKFFFVFWLALLLAGVGVGSAVWWHQQKERERIEAERDPLLGGGPRVTMALSAAASVLGHGGLPALRDLIAEWRGERMPRMFVVDDAGRDMFGRELSAELVADARARAEGDDPRRPARLVTAPDGQRFLLLVPQLPGDRFDPRREPPPGRGEPPRGGRPPFDRHGPLPPSPWLPIVVGLIASVAASALLAWYLARPIRNLRWAFGAVASGQLETRVGPLMGARRDEIADLGGDFDRMAQQIQHLIGAQRRLLHDVSHELRSPLARLQAAIGLARQDPAKLEATLDRIEREAVRLDELVGQLLTIARLDAGTRDSRSERVELFDLAAAIADDARFEAQSRGRELNFSGEGEAEGEMRVELVQRAFENVIRNAVKYTAEGTTVEVRASAADGRFVLTVADRGPGVPEADLTAIFEPFYRSAGGQSAGGFGLGLAIARRAVEAHGGHIRASNRPDGGLAMEIVLPFGPVAAAQKPA